MKIHQKPAICRLPGVWIALAALLLNPGRGIAAAQMNPAPYSMSAQQAAIAHKAALARIAFAKAAHKAAVARIAHAKAAHAAALERIATAKAAHNAALARIATAKAAHNAAVARIASAKEAQKPVLMTSALPAATGMPDGVSLDFVSADINDVLKALALQSHANIVSGNDVKGSITVSLTGVTLEEALDMITKLSGYQYAKVGRTYVVGTPLSISTFTAAGSTAPTVLTAVLTFNYSDPNDLETTIASRFPDAKVTQGKASGGQASGGVLIITATAAEIEFIRNLIAQSEEALSRGIAEAKTEVYNIKYASADDLESVLARLVPSIIITPGPSQGFKLTAPSTADAGGTTSTTTSYGATAAGAAPGAAGAGSAPQAVKPTTYSLLLTGTGQDIARALAILAQVDTRPLQIDYEAKITEINLNSVKNLGLNWDFSGATTRIGEMPDSTNQTVDANGPTLGDNGSTGNILKFGAIGRTAISSLATVKLDALFTNGDAKLLSDPNISAIDGQPAAVFIGDAIRYVSSITQTATGPTVTTDTVNIGIKLFVTGKASNDGYITLNIHPEVSTITGYLAVPGGGSLPQVSNREVTTTVRVKDGDILAIGGLISETDIKNAQKVPFLGDLPFFGSLFRDSQTSHGRNEVVIFVKVSIMKDAH